MATYEDFLKLAIAVGRITDVEDVPKAKKPVYKLTIDFGPEFGIKTSVAGLKNFYPADMLLNHLVVAVVNFPKKNVAGVESECLVLAAVENGKVVLLRPDTDVEPGTKIS